MQISQKLAYEIYIIMIFHITAVILLTVFTSFIVFKSRKTPLLNSYIAVVSMILVWMIAKILKTISPNQSIRWFFIMMQYFGIQFLGLFLLIFSLIYIYDKVPQRKSLFFISIPPFISYIIVITNPLHMKFYSYFDFYKDRFGNLFIPIQAIQYLYLLISILLLSRNFTKQQGLKNKRSISYLLSAIIIFTLLSNVYYIIFKLTPAPWIFPFPVFDFTPISCSFALILFTLPAIRYRFLDIFPASYQIIYNNLPQGVVYVDSNRRLQYYNRTFANMFRLDNNVLLSIEDLLQSLHISNQVNQSDLRTFFLNQTLEPNSLLFQSDTDKYFKIVRLSVSGYSILIFSDASEVLALTNHLNAKNNELTFRNEQLQKLALNTKELAITRTKADIAQNMHDILGHTFTVAMGNCSLIELNTHIMGGKKILLQVKELLISSLSDIQNSLNGKDFSFSQTSLTQAINALKNQNINLDFVIQGKAYELNTRQTETIFRLCQEAITNALRHSHAENIHIILRYQYATVEIYIIDDGIGCANLTKGYGLTGIEERIKNLEGTVTFGSDGNKGFHIHAQLPKEKRPV